MIESREVYSFRLVGQKMINRFPLFQSLLHLNDEIYPINHCLHKLHLTFCKIVHSVNKSKLKGLTSDLPSLSMLEMS